MKDQTLNIKMIAFLQLEALRTSKNQLKIESKTKVFNEAIVDKNNIRIHNIQCEISELYAKKRREEAQDRHLLMNIIETWQAIKKLRETQAFTNTPTMLKMRKYVV